MSTTSLYRLSDPLTDIRNTLTVYFYKVTPYMGRIPNWSGRISAVCSPLASGQMRGPFEKTATLYPDIQGQDRKPLLAEIGFVQFLAVILQDTSETEAEDTFEISAVSRDSTRALKKHSQIIEIGQDSHLVIPVDSSEPSI